jgi:glutaredoxin
MSENEVAQENQEKPQDFSPKDESSGKKKKIPWKPVAGFAAVAILFFAAGFLFPKGPSTGMVISQTPVVSSQEAGAKAVDYINNYLLQPGFSASLISANESNGLYSIEINITGTQGSTVYPSYVTKDGTLLFVSAVDISKKPETQTPAEQTPSTTVPKTDKPTVRMFVMSYCPYGKQAEAGLGPAVQAVGMSNFAFEPHFVIYENYNGGGPNYCFDNESKYCSMHGINEMREDIRQMVIWKYWPSKWWAYVDKVNAETTTGDIESKWKDIATSVGLDASDIQQKFDAEALTLLANEAALNAKYSVRGSPTVLINDVDYTGGRTPDAYQSGICAAFNTPPAGCGQTINSTANNSTTAAGGCGT